MIKQSESYQATSVAKRKQENFPVASLLLPRKVRRKVVALYNFARHADDIADNGDMSLEEREAKLCALRDFVLSDDVSNLPQWVLPYRECVHNGDVDGRHGLALLDAFIQDSIKARYQTWEELHDYCMLSAAPIGRAMCELHQEWAADWRASDAICNALQIINHLQDIKDDACNRDRVYLPLEWLESEADLVKAQMSDNLRQAVDKALDEVDRMLAKGAALLPTIKHRRFRMEVAIIHQLAIALSRKLRVNDVLSQHVSLSKMEKIRCVICGIKAAFSSRAAQYDGKKVAMRSKSSFLFPLLQLSGERKQAMLIFYAFCREIDDAVDDAVTSVEGEKNLTFWRKEVGLIYQSEVGENNVVENYPNHPLSRALARIIGRYDIPNEIMTEMLSGQEMDLFSTANQQPTLSILDVYCYRVASCVGLGSIRIFGYQNEATETFAIELGKCLQLINIMRDVQEDAERGRIYLPREYLEQAGLVNVTPEQIVQQADATRLALKHVGKQMALAVEQHYDTAMQCLPICDKRAMRPALMMYKVYYHYFLLLQKSDWDIGAARIRIGFFKKCFIALARGMPEKAQ